jgi:uroporphyrinogen-III synthase
MPGNKIHILSTRALDIAIINKAAEDDVIIDVMPFIKTEEVINTDTEKKIIELLQQKITAVFTSMNAVGAVKSYVSEHPYWKIYCIGNATRKLVTEVFGEESIAGFANDGEQLSQVILEDKTLRKLFFFCGNIRRDTIPATLMNNGIMVEEIVVYITIETPARIQKKYDGILFYSPSAVQSFFKANTISDKTELFAIGTTTANAIKQFSNKPVIIAEIPGKENLVDLAVKHFSKRKIL